MWHCLSLSVYCPVNGHLSWNVRGLNSPSDTRPLLWEAGSHCKDLLCPACHWAGHTERLKVTVQPMSRGDEYQSCRLSGPGAASCYFVIVLARCEHCSQHKLQNMSVLTSVSCLVMRLKILFLFLKWNILSCFKIVF